MRPLLGASAKSCYALAPGDGRDFDRLLTLADQAMYAGKQAGKQQIRRATAP
jgi:GGDEF domain-containing protein